MKNLIVHFTSGKFLSLSLPDASADEAIRGMNTDPGTTLITSDNGKAYLINRATVTHAIVEP